MVEVRRILLTGALMGALAYIAHAGFQLPSGFEIKVAAEPPTVRFPMFGATDGGRRLFVAESSGLDLYEELQKQTRRCRVSLLTDSDGEGRYEAASVFAEALVFPMGLAWHEGRLFVADPPELVTLEDTDRDGRADKRSVLLSGFGHQDNGSLHGLVIGPDGRLYMTIGQPDGYRLKRPDGSILESKGGALLRCRTDGSEVEVIARGFENLVEIVFLPSGDIVGTDNWFRLPQEGIRDALVHLVPGGVYPLNAHARSESGLFYSGELLPAIQLYPAVAHSGLMRYRGGNLPASMQGSLFSAQFNTRKVVRHELRRQGATFQSQDQDFLSTDNPDFHPSDVLEDADGSLLVIDTGSWYVQHCPTGRIRKAPTEGGIFRVRFNGPATNAAPETPPYEQLARETRSLTTESNLIPLLAHPAAHIRSAAAEALARCGTRAAVSGIVEALPGAEDEPFLTHALIYALHRAADAATLEPLLRHPHPEVKRAAIVLLDQAPHRKLPADAALQALKASNTRLRRTAIAALKNHPEWAPHLTEFLRQALDEATPARELLQDLVPAFATAQIKQALLERVADGQRSQEATMLLLDVVRRCPFEASEQDALRAALRRALRSSDSAIVGGALRLSVKGLHEDYARISSDSRLPVALRLDALHASVKHAPALTDTHVGLLISALSSTNPPQLRLSAAEIASTAQLATNQFRLFLQAVRDDPLISPETVFSAAQKAGYVEELLPYLARVARAGWQIPEATQAWLRASTSHADLQKILAEAADQVKGQRKLLAEFQPLLTGGDPNRGHQVYLGQAGCVACHRIGKHGGLLGPDLTRIGAIRSPEDILESLLIPAATIAQGYHAFEVELAGGESLSGIRVRQADDSLVLRDATGAETRIDARQIKRVVPLKNSLMPDGLLASLDREAVRDLLAYLRSLR